MDVLMAGKDPIAQLHAHREVMVLIAANDAVEIAKVVVFLEGLGTGVVKFAPETVGITSHAMRTLGTVNMAVNLVGCHTFATKNARICHHVTGKCNDGCENGYKNDDCKTLCDDGTYGEECKMTCGRCKDGTPCNKATGHCHDGCVGNVFGDKCDVCSAGKYGEYCELDCSTNCKDGEKLNCDRVSGRCYRGCKPGFIGDNCGTQCTHGSYGENCSSTCGRCGSGARCDASTGICLSSCLDSENCALQQRCEENWEGERCDVILVLIWRRRARTKPAEELSLNVLPANGVSPKVESQSNIQRQVRPRAQLPAIEASPQPDVIPPPVQLNVSPPLPTRPRSVAPPVPEVQSRLIPLFELAQYIEKSVASGQLAAQHAIFPRGLTAPSLEAARQENLGKNRWRNVVPYDASRVVLDPLPHKPHSNYINASYIDGYMKEKAFIATQGPKAETVDDLWRLMWQENVTCIVMLCNLTEGGKTKCEQYWPEVGYCAHYSNETLVRTNSENAFLDHTERIFTVSRGNNDASRNVMQLHYTSWPDHGVPRYAHSLACVLRQVPLVNDAPILVHCRGSCGPAGFAGTDTLTENEHGRQQRAWDPWTTVLGTQRVYVHGLRSRDRYVVTQLPLPNTLGDFWLLAWQREAQMVVVLNMPEPNDHVALWVEGGELSLPDHLKMRHVSVSGNALFDMHRVILSQRLPKRNEESREVCILSVKTWRAGEMAPHHPELLIRVWNEMQPVPETVILACHDGATASGLMVSAALMLEHLQATRRIDVVSAVRRARRTRPQFVQFEFLHSVMLAQVESMDTYVNI
ncbi:hypothetical protein B566_EDAN017077 [Ephemera danica]|nr:hypothetical protein B566_EDAN017077 [Ephemera danica]